MCLYIYAYATISGADRDDGPACEGGNGSSGAVAARALGFGAARACPDHVQCRLRCARPGHQRCTKGDGASGCHETHLLTYTRLGNRDCVRGMTHVDTCVCRTHLRVSARCQGKRTADRRTHLQTDTRLGRRRETRLVATRYWSARPRVT